MAMAQVTIGKYKLVTLRRDEYLISQIIAEMNNTACIVSIYNVNKNKNVKALVSHVFVLPAIHNL